METFNFENFIENILLRNRWGYNFDRKQKYIYTTRLVSFKIPLVRMKRST